MDFNEFLEHFSEQFYNVPREAFHPDTKFRDFEEWDSLSSLSLVAMIYEEYGIRITGGDIRVVSTIKELFDLVSSHKD